MSSQIRLVDAFKEGWKRKRANTTDSSANTVDKCLQLVNKQREPCCPLNAECTCVVDTGEEPTRNG